MAEDEELLYVNGHVFDTDDLTYGERREIKRIARTEIWDEDVDGPWEDMTADDIMPAIILVLMRRDTPGYTLELAMQEKPEQVFRNPHPPTKPSSRKSSTTGTKASAGGGAKTTSAASGTTT